MTLARDDEAGDPPGEPQGLGLLMREVAELRAEQMVLEMAVASLAADAVRDSEDPIEALGQFTTRLIAFAEMAGRGLRRAGIGRPQEITAAADRLATRAETFLHQS